ncbi:AAA family ATPase [Dongshaea marina]|uniref:AAA family ATPase n=1 Tax=Dongshaea marina TaxID=2047966 RepID=UPI000D3ECBEB|nr:MoxR family ATPase [Dongshaea marina]
MPQATFSSLKNYLNHQVIGQPMLTEHLLIALLANGHILVEGPPGLAKTRVIRTLAKAVEGSFHRIQFTPDLLPADLTGTDIYRPEDGSFSFQKGPLFHNLLLADEINRAPAKVQSALLEAMAENQISVGQHTYALPKLFLVMATQNPIEQEGTYPLPEAQLDRFMLHLELDYPSAEAELDILHLNLNEARELKELEAPELTQQMLFEARQQVLGLHMEPALEQYLVALINATRRPENYCSELKRWLSYGISPRATLALAYCSRAKAWLAGRDFVLPEDIQECLYPVLRHRLLLSYEAEAEEINRNQIISRLLEVVALT